jgi:hypothetical protein
MDAVGSAEKSGQVDREAAEWSFESHGRISSKINFAAQSVKCPDFVN